MKRKNVVQTWLSAIGIALLLFALAGCGGGDGGLLVAAPAQPSGVNATAANGQVTVGWTAVAGAASYNVYYGTTAGVTKSAGTFMANVTGTTATKTGLADGTTYYFVVTAVNFGGESSLSSEVSAIPLAIPTGVSATSQHTQATISWTAAAGAASYNIYYGTTPGVTKSPGALLTNVTGTTTYTKTGLLDGTTYYFVVTSVNATGESPISAEVSATPITSPSGIVASAENGQATIAWLSVPGATSYNLYYGTTNPVTTSNSTKIAVTGAAAGTSNGTPFYSSAVTPLTNGTTYYFTVTAVNAGEESLLSSQKSAVPSATVPKPGSPAAVTITPGATAGQVHLIWGDYVPDATSYNAYYLQQTAQPTTSTVISTGTKVTLLTPSPQDLPGFTSGATYWFVVTAVNALGQESGGQTNPKSVVAP